MGKHSEHPSYPKCCFFAYYLFGWRYCQKGEKSNRAVPFLELPDKLKLRGTTARRRSIPESDFLEMAVSVPPLDEQKHAVDVIALMRKIMKAREDELSALDGLAKARFVAAFETITFLTIIIKLLAKVHIAVADGHCCGAKQQYGGLSGNPLYTKPYAAKGSLHE
ncbi:MAG: hypothetical protein E7425_12230 [Ruminococcaceae bacterium]|nr:hypothetical protein [Oscillospiraceae bacterium]